MNAFFYCEHDYVIYHCFDCDHDGDARCSFGRGLWQFLGEILSQDIHRIRSFQYSTKSVCILF